MSSLLHQNNTLSLRDEESDDIRLSARSYHEASVPLKRQNSAAQKSMIELISGTSTELGLNDNITDHSTNSESAKSNVDNNDQRFAIVLSMLQDPIQCGYLLYFSTLEYNSENLCFIMMVSRFRQAMRQDCAAWPIKPAQVDKETAGQDEFELVRTTTWPSKKLSKTTIEKMVQSIWDEFISDDARSQICMSSNIVTNTKRRMLLLDLYGPNVFAEALLDPIKTINEDMLPRFLASTFKVDMDKRLQTLKIKVQESDIQVEPIDNPLLKSSIKRLRNKKMFTFNETIHNQILYNEFLKYLQQNMLVKYLLCSRMVSIFEDLFMAETPESLAEATDYAWNIFRYFLAKDAPCGISLHSRHIKEIMISLANIHVQMFAELEKVVLPVLKDSFKLYSSAVKYDHLRELMEAGNEKSIWGVFKKSK